MSSMFEALISGARDAGREVIRIGGDMTWALDKMPTAEKLLEWEAFYDRYVGPRSGFVALCQYDHGRFGGSVVMCALQTHPLSIIGGESTVKTHLIHIFNKLGVKARTEAVAEAARRGIIKL